jgi:photosystem II stability/assembly factor-like uncharacterized protein
MATRPAPLLVLFSVLASACTDDPSAPVALQPPPGAPGGGGVLVECRADVSAARMTCAPVAPGAGGASADLILGGQGTYVQLANDSITVGGGVFSTRVTVQNLTVQPMGTLDGTTVSSRGVRVFFHQGPTNGVEVANEDGMEMYTAPAQPYFQYDGILQPQQVSAGRTWRFTLNGETGSFSFQVLVIAEVPSENGFLRMEKVHGNLTAGLVADFWVDSTVVIGVGAHILRSLDGGHQWTLRSSGTTAYLYSVWGSGATIVAVGTGGTIRRSTNRGYTWTGVDSGTGSTLYSVWGDGANVVAVGSGGTIIHSTDGGATWAVVASGTTNTLHGVSGTSASLVAVGDHATMLRSTDGGSTWAEVFLEITQDLTAVWGDGNFFVVGARFDERNLDPGCTFEYCAVILRSTDTGATWAKWYIDTYDGVYSLWGEGSLLLAGNAFGGREEGGEVFRSTDAGTTWSRVTRGAGYQGILTIAGWGQTVMAAGANDYGAVILRSTDAGRQWTSLVSERTTYHGIWSDGTTVVALAVDMFGVASILRSGNGGATWTGSSYFGPRYAGVWGQDSTVVAVGPRGASIRSTNAGVTWDTATLGSRRSLHDLHGDGTTMVAVGDTGTILRSTDRGATWSPVPSGTTQALLDVWMQGSSALAVGRAGTLVRSTDGGATWSATASGTTHDLTGVWGEQSTVVIVGAAGHIQRSTDGGATWTPVSSGTTASFRDVSGSGSTVVAVNGSATLLRSSDGGATWHALQSRVDVWLYSLWMLSDRNVFVGGDDDTIFRGTR